MEQEEEEREKLLKTQNKKLNALARSKSPKARNPYQSTFHVQAPTANSLSPQRDSLEAKSLHPLI